MCTGNADEQNYKESELYVSADKSEEAVALLLEDLEKELGITSVVEKLKDTDFDARIIIGEK